jgi:Domain of unknown function (DUF4296)
MKTRQFPLLLLCFVLGCSSQQTEPLPISQEKLVELMFDVHVAEGALSQLPGGPKKDSIADQYYDQVAEIQQVDRAVLDTCLAILQRNPDLSKEVYEKVMELMDKRRLEK